MAELLDVYRRMLAHFGPSRWWPAETPYEVAVGAILTQSVSWKNVEQAIGALKARGLCDPHAMYRADPGLIAELIRPTRYFRQKTKKLLAFTKELVEVYGGSMERMLDGPTDEVRRRLRAIHGVGDETADSILLYAGGHPVFVVDAYTRRIFQRIGLLPEDARYGEVQAFFEQRLPRDTGLFNEYHALIVRLGNRYCRAKEPECPACPLAPVCAYVNGAAGSYAGKSGGARP